MKKINLLILSFFVLSVLGVKAQDIPNNSFENWTAGVPDGWLLLSGKIEQKQSETVTIGTTQHNLVATDGSNYMKLWTDTVGAPTGTAFRGLLSTAFAYNKRPAGFDARMAYLTSNANERFAVYIQMFKNTTGTREFVYNPTNQPVVLTQTGSLPFVNINATFSPASYVLPDNPDSCVITISSSVPTNPSSLTINARVLVDFIKFKSHGVGVGGVNVESVGSVSNYPNPFNGLTQISYTLMLNSDVEINVMDLSGKVVANVFNGKQEAGHQTVEFDGSNLKPGIYLYQLNANGNVITNKMVVTR